jgi:hypothetical protein
MCIMGYSTFTKFRDNSRCLSVNNHELSQQSIKNLSVHRCVTVLGGPRRYTDVWTLDERMDERRRHMCGGADDARADMKHITPGYSAGSRAGSERRRLEARVAHSPIYDFSQ